MKQRLSFVFISLILFVVTLSSINALANPAAVLCVNYGYKYTIVNSTSGQSGVCEFPDKTTCDEWAFYNKQCGTSWYNQPFSDVAGSTFEQYINRLYRAQIISGYTNGTFRPNEKVTRGQMCKFIVKAFGIPEDLSGSDFDDVGSDNVFYPYIKTLKAKGIVGGYNDGTFRPDEFVTRGATTKFVVLAMNKGYSPSTIYQQNTYWDVSKSHTFANYISFLNDFKSDGQKVISGYADGSFKPDELITRGQMAKVIDLGRNAVKAPDVKELCEQNTGTWLETSKQCNYINQSTCTTIGGTYNSCGSACGRNYTGACIERCVEACYF